MAHHREKLVLGPFGRLALGDVLDHEHQLDHAALLVPNRRGGHIEPQLPPAARHERLLDLEGGPLPADKLTELGSHRWGELARQQGAQVAVRQLVTGVADEPAECGVDLVDPALHGDEHDAHGGVLEVGLATGLALLESGFGLLAGRDVGEERDRARVPALLVRQRGRGLDGPERAAVLAPVAHLADIGLTETPPLPRGAKGRDVVREQHVLDAKTDLLFGLVTRHLGELTIGEGDAPVMVGGPDPLERTFDHGAVAGLAGHHRLTGSAEIGQVSSDHRPARHGSVRRPQQRGAVAEMTNLTVGTPVVHDERLAIGRLLGQLHQDRQGLGVPLVGKQQPRSPAQRLILRVAEKRLCHLVPAHDDPVGIKVDDGVVAIRSEGLAPEPRQVVVT